MGAPGAAHPIFIRKHGRLVSQKLVVASKDEVDRRRTSYTFFCFTSRVYFQARPPRNVKRSPQFVSLDTETLYEKKNFGKHATG